MAANKFVYTANIVAKEALSMLTTNTVFGSLVYRDYASEFTASKRGDTIQIKRPASFVLNEFEGTTTPQTISEGAISLQLSKHFDITVAVTSKEWTLELADFRESVIRPAMLAFQQGIDELVAGLYTEACYFAGASGEGPTTLAHLAALDRAMNEQKIPLQNRVCVVSPRTKEAMFSIDAVARADARGDGGSALREASMGRIMGINWYMDQNIRHHIAGTASGVEALAISAQAEAGASTINIDGGSASETLEVGDVFSIEGCPGSFTVTEKATASSGAFTGVKFYPPLPQQVKDNTGVTVQGSGDANLAFVRRGIALATVPLELPQGAADAAMVSMDGIGIRVVYDYDSKSKTDTISFDMLAGAKIIDPRLVTRWVY